MKINVGQRFGNTSQMIIYNEHTNLSIAFRVFKRQQNRNKSETKNDFRKRPIFELLEIGLSRNLTKMIHYTFVANFKEKDL